MIIWTSSTKDRAEGILKDLGLAPFFARLIAREDYDPANAGRIKNVKSVKADWFIDDDPKQVEAARKSGVKCLLVPAYRRRHKLPPDDIEVIEKALLG